MSATLVSVNESVFRPSGGFVNYPLDPTLRAQAQALVAQMTLAEKVDFCSGKDFWHLPELERLQIPSIMVTDEPHGLRKQGQVPTTLVPTAAFPPLASLPPRHWPVLGI